MYGIVFTLDVSKMSIDLSIAVAARGAGAPQLSVWGGQSPQ